MHRIAVAIAALVSIFIIAPASAQVVITQAKALAGNVTQGDTAGYPITISQPGAYRLESNLTVPSGVYGIYITADSVDIDMNGFTLTGNGTGTWGVISNSGESRIHDGVINRFRYSGIYLRGSAWTIEDMTIARNGTMGIDAQNSNFITVRQSTIGSNGAYGIFLNDNGTVEDNTVFGNGDVGIFIEAGGLVEGNLVSNNGSSGILVNNGGFIIGNSVRRNVSFGINNNFGNTVLINNSLYLNNHNNNSSNKQILNGVNVSGNFCVGKPCY